MLRGVCVCTLAPMKFIVEVLKRDLKLTNHPLPTCASSGGRPSVIVAVDDSSSNDTDTCASPVAYTAVASGVSCVRAASADLSASNPASENSVDTVQSDMSDEAFENVLRSVGITPNRSSETDYLCKSTPSPRYTVWKGDLTSHLLYDDATSTPRDHRNIFTRSVVDSLLKTQTLIVCKTGEMLFGGARMLTEKSAALAPMYAFLKMDVAHALHKSELYTMKNLRNTTMKQVSHDEFNSNIMDYVRLLAWLSDYTKSAIAVVDLEKSGEAPKEYRMICHPSTCVCDNCMSSRKKLINTSPIVSNIFWSGPESDATLITFANTNAPLLPTFDVLRMHRYRKRLAEKRLQQGVSGKKQRIIHPTAGTIAAVAASDGNATTCSESTSIHHGHHTRHHHTEHTAHKTHNHHDRHRHHHGNAIHYHRHHHR